MAGGCHEKQNDEREHPKLLKREVNEAAVVAARDENTDDGIHVAKRVELNEPEHAVARAEQEGCHTEMAAVIQQRQKASIETAQRANRQDDV